MLQILTLSSPRKEYGGRARHVRVKEDGGVALILAILILHRNKIRFDPRAFQLLDSIQHHLPINMRLLQPTPLALTLHLLRVMCAPVSGFRAQ